MADSIEARIQSAILRAANEIAAAVRADIISRTVQLFNGAPVAARTTAPKATTPKRRGRKPGRAAANTGLIDRVTAYIQANPGKRSEEIGKAIGSDVKPALAKLRAEGKVKTRGERRATTYSMA
jgi:hypothetical protein